MTKKNRSLKTSRKTSSSVFGWGWKIEMITVEILNSDFFIPHAVGETKEQTPNRENQICMVFFIFFKKYWRATFYDDRDVPVKNRNEPFPVLHFTQEKGNKERSLT